MVRHIVSWNYQEGFSEKQNEEHALKIKKDLEGLVEQINGLIELKVYTNTLPSSNRDIILPCI